MQTEYFKYTWQEAEYLKSKDKKLGEVIDKIGMIERKVIPDTFQALINSIIGQQISTKAHETIWQRMNVFLKEVTPENIANMSTESLQQLGLSFRKVEYIKGMADKILNQELDLIKLKTMDDAEVCDELSKIKGVGKWTAEMIMLFSMQRKNILSYGDLAILRGMRMVYHHRKITEAMFNKYWRRYTPYASIASLYFWEVASGAIPGMKDYAPKNKK